MIRGRGLPPEDGVPAEDQGRVGRVRAALIPPKPPPSTTTRGPSPSPLSAESPPVLVEEGRGGTGTGRPRRADGTKDDAAAARRRTGRRSRSKAACMFSGRGVDCCIVRNSES